MRLTDSGLWRLANRSFRHSLGLRSAYDRYRLVMAQQIGCNDTEGLGDGEPEATNVTKTFVGTLDYIFFSRSTLRSVAVCHATMTMLEYLC